MLPKVSTMQKLYVPFSNNLPAAVEINGHRLLIVCSQSADLASDLAAVGAKEVREVEVDDGELESAQALADLAAGINGGVVLTPPGISAGDMIANLQLELPWIH